MAMTMRRGTSFIDLMISIGIIAVLFGGIYLIYFSLITAIANISVRTAAATAIQAEIETIRNLSYASVGTVNGVPPGAIPQSQTATVGNYSFILQTVVRNIDDPFDGVLGGIPNDTAPADYKLVSIQATCPLCANFGTVIVTTTVAPKNLESATQNGSLFVSALDANGGPLAGVSVHVVNASVTPSIDLTDTTNANGVLQLVGVPTSTQGYQVAVSKTGYSSDKTYPIGDPANPNPVKPHATVAAQTVTSITFAIDRVSALTVRTSDNRCATTPNISFSMNGTKLIGTSPNVLKFSTTSATDAGGTKIVSNVEWDTYALSLNDSTKNLVGAMPMSPLTINPSSTVDFRFVVLPAANPSLDVTVADAATGASIANATVTISTTGFSATQTTGHATVTDTDWSGGKYFAKSGGVDVDSTPGSAKLLVNASGTYTPGPPEWLISNTIDLGGSSSTLYAISWNPASQPAGATLKFQIAANNDGATWNFIGPDGTAGTYFTASSSLPSALFGNRYLRYKAYLQTTDGAVTPRLDDISLEFAANCVPPAQTLFTSIPQGTYSINVTAPNYAAGSATSSVGGGAQSATVLLTHL